MSNNLRHQAHQIIKDKIISFKLKPGDEIREGSIAKELSMGRTPVREALLMLEHEKLIECRSNLGYVVKKLTRKEAEDYYALREALELFAAPLIIERITPEAVAELGAILAQSERRAKENDIQGVAECNTEFHKLLYKATDSEAFVELIFQLIDKIRWLLAMAVASQKGPAEALEDHGRIVSVIKKRDVEALKKEICVHLQHAKERYLSIAAVLF
ncbi:MAG: GntR family transcriptional regulator [Syntrophorhabdaceae bacterium]|nr:GntR family transcriptional regulator [Syntrophorhabdaceae bacterium]MDD5243431.1 GntR family transcriptional regulator [Syntrophorhabdaceae bacterium]